MNKKQTETLVAILEALHARISTMEQDLFVAYPAETRRLRALTEKMIATLPPLAIEPAPPAAPLNPPNPTAPGVI